MDSDGAPQDGFSVPGLTQNKILSIHSPMLELRGTRGRYQIEAEDNETMRALSDDGLKKRNNRLTMREEK
jgi:hypothetical protein